MFDNLDLPPELSGYLVSITPVLGISGTIDNYNLYAIPKYIPLPNNKILISTEFDEIPMDMTLNVLRKGEDDVLISAYSKSILSEKALAVSKKINSPFYTRSIVVFELKFEKDLQYETKEKLAIYSVVHAHGVAGLDPSFNDEVTMTKTFEVMSLTAVDTYVIERKLEK